MDAIHIHTESGGSEGNFPLISTDDMREENAAVDPSGHQTIDRDLPQGSDIITDFGTINSPMSPPVAIPVSDPNAEFDSAETDDTTPDLGGGSDCELSEKAQSLPQTQSQSHSRSTSLSLPGEYEEKPRAPPISLPTLLCQACDLLAAYPPSSPALRLTETFGPQSALRTNGLTVFTSLPDDVAESFVGGDSVVLPITQEEEDEESFHTKRPKNRKSEQEKLYNGRPIRIANGLVVRRQTLVAGVVLLLGVAVALYGFSPGGKCGRNGNTKIGSNMRFAVVWVGGLLGLGERLGVGL